MRKNLKLSPYNLEQKLRLVLDGARTAGTSFLLIQYADDKDVAKGVNIIHSGSNLLPLDRDFSCMKAEAIALDRAISACNHWLYYCPEVELILDFQGLMGLLDKYMAYIENRSLQKIIIRAGNYNW